jgi:hypothetical protein
MPHGRVQKWRNWLTSTEIRGLIMIRPYRIIVMAIPLSFFRQFIWASLLFRKWCGFGMYIYIWLRGFHVCPWQWPLNITGFRKAPGWMIKRATNDERFSRILQQHWSWISTYNYSVDLYVHSGAGWNWNYDCQRLTINLSGNALIKRHLPLSMGFGVYQYGRSDPSVYYVTLPWS